MVEQNRAAAVASELRGNYFRRWGSGALAMWAVLWFLGTLKYGPFGTGVFVIASLGSVWLAAWIRAERVANAHQSAPETSIEDVDSKKAA